MKKTLLSVLAGLTVMGSAFADGPSVEDRKKLCQLLIDKGTHVWVEKTEACIPVNPCKSDDEQIKKAYCINYLSLQNGASYTGVLHLYDKSAIDITVAKIAERLGTGATSQNLPGHFFAIKTTDGGYYAAEYNTKKERNQMRACEQESETITLIFGNYLSGESFGGEKMINYKTQIPVTEQECTDMKDIGNLLYGYASRQTDIKYDKDQKECIFTCFD